MEKNKLVKIVDTIPTVLENTTLDIKLEGWPAAVTAFAFFASCVSIYALKVTHPTDETATKSEEMKAA